MIEQAIQRPTQLEEMCNAPNLAEIKAVLGEFVGKLKEIVFGELTDYVVNRIKENPFDIKEVWIGIVDVSIADQISVAVIAAVSDPTMHTDIFDQRSDYLCDLELDIAENFKQLNHVNIGLSSFPYEQHEHSAPIPRLVHPELWRKVYEA